MRIFIRFENKIGGDQTKSCRLQKYPKVKYKNKILRHPLCI